MAEQTKPKIPVPVPAEIPMPRDVPTPTPPEYATGAVKQDPTTLAVAVRTDIPDVDYSHDWGVMTIEHGGHYATWDEVSTWDDLAVTAR
jgi:hypothetical protein